MSKKPETNEFFDINKFPKEPGITYFALSMPLLNNVQSPEKCFEMDKHIISKIQVSNVGAQVVYTDNLYMYSDQKAVNLKLKHQKLIGEHKRSWLKLIRQDINIIPSAFTFMTWNQLILECDNFSEYLKEFKERCESDAKMMGYIKEDIESTGREYNELTIGYIQEEILLDYLVVKGVVNMPNEYTKGKEEWILNCYHGKPHRAYVYLVQQNYFDLNNEKNVYQDSWYDAENKKLYEFDRLDIDTFDFTK